MLSKLAREQSASQDDIEPFERSPLDFTYFMSMFQESVEKKIDDPRGRLTQLNTPEESHENWSSIS